MVYEWDRKFHKHNGNEFAHGDECSSVSHRWVEAGAGRERDVRARGDGGARRRCDGPGADGGGNWRGGTVRVGFALGRCFGF